VYAIENAHCLALDQDWGKVILDFRESMNMTDILAGTAHRIFHDQRADGNLIHWNLA
jgi:hypothetical protein